MPFTPSHMAAALPFVRTPLPIAPLVVGTMAPDVPYFLPIRIPRDLTHSLLGAPTVDLAITVVLVLLWYAVVRAPAVDLLPVALRERIPRPDLGAYRRVRMVLLALLAALVGILTHLVWDAFTHADSPVVRAVPLLHAPLGPLSVSSWLQYLSSIAGLVVLAVWVRAWTVRTPRVAGISALSPGTRGVAWSALVLAFGLTAGAVAVVGMLHGIHPLTPNRLFSAVTLGGAAAGLAAALFCAIWWARWRRTPVAG